MSISCCFECGVPAECDNNVVPRSTEGTKTVPLCGVCHGKTHIMRIGTCLLASLPLGRKEIPDFVPPTRRGGERRPILGFLDFPGLPLQLLADLLDLVLDEPCERHRVEGVQLPAFVAVLRLVRSCPEIT